MGAAEKGLWGLVTLTGGYCAVTMVLVPLLAFTAGGYLAATEQYVVATAVVIAGAGLAYRINQRDEPLLHRLITHE